MGNALSLLMKKILLKDLENSFAIRQQIGMTQTPVKVFIFVATLLVCNQKNLGKELKKNYMIGQPWELKHISKENIRGFQQTLRSCRTWQKLLGQRNKKLLL